MFGWWGRVAAIWDNAGQLVELRDEIEATNVRLDELFQTMNTINERTRKQSYRERKDAEHVAFETAQLPADPGGARTQLVRAARARGLIR